MEKPENGKSKTGQPGIGQPGIGPRMRAIPDGDNRARLVCPDCGFIKYDNPLVVVGAVAAWEDRILLCRRAIAPRRGYWTLPAGYLELHETAADGARRETREEAGAEIEIDALLAVYNIPRISQIQLIYRARLRSPDIAPGEESEAVALYDWASIPWADIAFPSVHWALKDFQAVRGQRIFATRGNPPDAQALDSQTPDTHTDGL